MTEQETSAKLKARIGLFQGYMEDAAFVEAPAAPAPIPMPEPTPIPSLATDATAASAGPPGSLLDEPMSAIPLMDGIDLSSAAVTAAVHARLAAYNENLVEDADSNVQAPLQVEWEPPRTSALSGWVPTSAPSTSDALLAKQKSDAMEREREIHEEARRLAEAMSRKAAVGVTAHPQTATGDFPTVTPSGVFRNMRASHQRDAIFGTRRTVDKKEKMSNFLFSLLMVVLLGILCTIVIVFLVDPKL